MSELLVNNCCVFQPDDVEDDMSETEGNWAILRQLVIATGDAVGHGRQIAADLRLPEGFADPELDTIGLADFTMPVGPQKYLEVVGPLNDDSYVNRWLAKAGGGGYCLSVQVPDVPACKARALAAGVRLAADQDVMGHPIIQMHPQDVGILLELDGIADRSQWFWDDITPGPNADAVVDDVLAVRIGVPDPAATAAQWAHIIGLELASTTSLDFSGCLIEFLPNATGQVLSADFQVADGAEAPADGDMHGLGVAYKSRTSTGS
jgi:hypothetical protein